MTISVAFERTVNPRISSLSTDGIDAAGQRRDTLRLAGDSVFHGLRDQSVNSLQSCQPFTHRIVCRPEAVLQRRYRGTQGVNITPWVFTVFWSVVIADAFASAFIITPPAAPSPIIIPFTNSTEVEM